MINIDVIDIDITDSVVTDTNPTASHIIHQIMTIHSVHRRSNQIKVIAKSKMSSYI